MDLPDLREAEGDAYGDIAEMEEITVDVVMLASLADAYLGFLRGSSTFDDTLGIDAKTDEVTS